MRAAILISSFDGAADLWHPLFQSYQKFWRRRPFRTYLSTNFLDPGLIGFETLKIGKEKSWSDNIRLCLGKIDEDAILLTFDDLFPIAPIDSARIEWLLEQFDSFKMSYLGMHPFPRPNEFVVPELGRIRERSLYRASTVWSLWRKDVLASLLDPSESAWQFECHGSARSESYAAFYRVQSVVIPHLNGVIKGLWVPHVARKLEREGFLIDTATRRVMSKPECLLEFGREVRSRLFRLIVPEARQQRFKSLFSENDYAQKRWH